MGGGDGAWDIKKTLVRAGNWVNRATRPDPTIPAAVTHFHCHSLLAVLWCVRPAS